MTLVVDASVALKWVLPEEGSERARAVIGPEDLLAPDFLLIECANVLTTKARRGLLSRSQAADSLEALAAGPVRLVPATPLVARAHALAVELGRSAYDSLYLALALAENAVLITADERFAAAARPYMASVRRL